MDESMSPTSLRFHSARFNALRDAASRVLRRNLHVPTRRAGGCGCPHDPSHVAQRTEKPADAYGLIDSSSPRGASKRLATASRQPTARAPLPQPPPPRLQCFCDSLVLEMKRFGNGHAHIRYRRQRSMPFGGGNRLQPRRLFYRPRAFIFDLRIYNASFLVFQC